VRLVDEKSRSAVRSPPDRGLRSGTRLY